MGYLLAGLTSDMLEIIWEGWQVGSKPSGREEIRLAAKIERKLIGVSTEEDSATHIRCPKCSNEFNVTEAPHVNFWRIATKRVMLTPAVLFLEDAQYGYLVKILSQLQPPQPRILLFDELLDVLDNVEKNWRGDEPALRLKYDKSIKDRQTTVVAP